jgi:peptidoglycan L-alanyl-D-glutamate endopeptidase CwlK
MPKFSERSKKKLNRCHPLLQLLASEVVKYYDCTVVWGYRGEADQNKFFAEGKSEVKFPDGKHNKLPAEAIDLVPYINGRLAWDVRQCYHFAGYVLATAHRLGIPIRCGADWDGDTDVNDQTFNDLTHFELLNGGKL